MNKSRDKILEYQVMKVIFPEVFTNKIQNLDLEHQTLIEIHWVRKVIKVK